MDTTDQNDKPSLPEKTKVFCQEIFKDFNLVEAYRRAGFGSGKDDDYDNAMDLISCDDVIAHLQQLDKERIRPVHIDSNNVMDLAVQIAFANMENFVTHAADGNIEFKGFDQIHPSLIACIKRLKVTKKVARPVNSKREFIIDHTLEIELHAKEPVLRMLMEHYQLLKPKLERVDFAKQLEAAWQRLEAHQKGKQLN